MVDAIESLRRHFGDASFRPGQEALVRAVLDGRDVLAVMPTGSGKSARFSAARRAPPGHDDRGVVAHRADEGSAAPSR